ncbi:unnamed protein product [Polarella glacialis]|uniref:BD-FAE-like domain-containing protein n=1 Tax=Polarella glacialis TaxID=89957 RepID=A0A813FZQ4_POLGL|nr:unnamed protein product [Polarella glacialis]
MFMYSESLLPLAALLYSGSLLAAFQLAGSFCGWSLTLLVADLVASIYVTRGGLKAAPALGACLAVLGVASALFSWLCVSREFLLVGVYRAFLAAEAVVGLAIGWALRVAASSLLADEEERIEVGEWRLWVLLLVLVEVIYVAGWLQLAAQACFCFMTCASTQVAQARLSSSLDEPADTELLAIPNQMSASSLAAPPGSPDCLEAALINSDGGLAWLVAGTAAFLWYQAFPGGEVYTITGAAFTQPCTGCHCNRADGDIEITRGVTYGAALDPSTGQIQDLVLDIYRSKEPRNSSLPAPALMLIHGGNFFEGGRDDGYVVGEAAYWARRGIDYRLEASQYLAQNAAVRDAVFDAKAAVRFVAKHSRVLGVDPERIAAWGFSAGAIAAGSLSFVAAEGDSGNPSGNPGYPSKIAAAVGISGSMSMETRLGVPEVANQLAWIKGAKQHACNWLGTFPGAPMCNEFFDRRSRRLWNWPMVKGFEVPVHCDPHPLRAGFQLGMQRIADCAGDCDEQLMSLARQTHFTVQEIGRLREEIQLLPGRGRESAAESGLDLETFKNLVRRAAPEFPLELCGRLFQKLDYFGVGRLAFVELACGMSALSLGTMDEKLQVCFDLFDSEGRRALTLKDLNDLCTTLFRVALAQGFKGTKTANTDEVLQLDRSESRLGSWVETERATASVIVPSSSLPFQSQGSPGRRIDGVLPADDSPGSAPRISRRPSAEEPLAPLPLFSTLPRVPSSGSKTRHSTGVCSSNSPRPRRPKRWLPELGQELPWRSMLLRLLSAAKVRTPGGPLLVAFDDFRAAAHMEPALLCLFAWCLPRPPEISSPAFLLGDPLLHHPVPNSLVSRLCRCFCRLLGRISNFS